MKPKREKPIVFTYAVEIANINISDNNGEGYYSFDYKIFKNGKLKHKGNYDSDYSNQTAREFRNVLKKGYAAQLALEQIF